MTTLSPSFISEIERRQANPSVAALQKLTASYGVSIVELMEEPVNEPRTLVRVDDRQVYAVTAGVRMEQLNFGPHQMELHLFTVDPGAGTGETYHHAGEEFIFLSPVSWSSGSTASSGTPSRWGMSCTSVARAFTNGLIPATSPRCFSA
jgi:hypothetical protein